MAVAYGAADGPDRQHAQRAACVVGPDGKVVKWWAKVDPRTFAADALQELPPATR